MGRGGSVPSKKLGQAVMDRKAVVTNSQQPGALKGSGTVKGDNKH